MLPIVNDPVKGAKVYIFNRTVHTKHPLAGLKLANSTTLHLQQGPITVFEEDEYAGDAQITDIPPNSTRLLTYAMDLDTEIVTTHNLPTSVVESLIVWPFYSWRFVRFVVVSLQRGGENHGFR
jgi:hypothetical protein